MATYRTIASSETDPQAPITSALMKALDANVTSTAEGAPGAPRIVPTALAGGRMLGRISGTGTAWTAISGMDDVSEIGALIFSTDAPSTLRCALSSDGGASWAASSSVATFLDPGSQWLHLNLQTGVFESVYTTGTLALPAGDVNAVRFSLASAGGIYTVMPYIEGGRP